MYKYCPYPDVTDNDEQRIVVWLDYIQIEQQIIHYVEISE